MNLAAVIGAMEQVFKDVPYGIEHTNQVLRNAEMIMDGESTPEETRVIVSLASILHDIGALEAQRKHGSMAGHLQEIEGPPIAREILNGAGVDAATVERVCFIVGHHHSPEKIDGIDFQIVWEADTLEALLHGPERSDPAALLEKVEANFRTSSGRTLAMQMINEIHG